MPVGRALSVTGDIAYELLKLTAASADVFPPLKSAVEGALHIVDLVKKFKSNRQEWHDLGIYVQNVTASVVDLMARIGLEHETREKLVRLNKSLEEVSNAIELEQARSGFERLTRFSGDPERIAGMKKTIDDAIGVFQLSATGTTMIDVKNTLRAVEKNSISLMHIAETTSTIAQETAVVIAQTSSISQSSVLDKLHKVPGGSLDSSKACLKDTRVELVDEILTWANGGPHPNLDQQSGGATILLLTAVAGAGKTTVAHTVAHRCKEAGQLGASFFFDRETHRRNSPAELWTSIAADLCQMNKEYASRVVEAIEAGCLSDLSISNQFEELIVKPCQGVRFPQPVVIVIDALDEAWDVKLIHILRDRTCHLPSIFRIFLTSRMHPELGSLLSQPHVKIMELKTDDQTNIGDVALFVPFMLQALAKDMSLDKNWPGDVLTAGLLRKAGGLFQWVTTVCEYLRQFDDPTEELEKLVTLTDPAATTAEEKMDRLYASIIESFNPRDKLFVNAYHIVMGTAIASKTPLTILAMEEFYNKHPLATDRTLQRLSPLLTGTNKSDYASHGVRVLHQSLRDFLVLRFVSLSGYTCFRVDETERNTQLAILCLKLLNTNLNSDMPVVGYLAHDDRENLGIPKLRSGALSEALWYACQFWPEHVCKSDDSTATQEDLVEFMTNRIVKWLEMIASYGRCRDLADLWGWIENKFSQQEKLRVQEWKEMYAGACLALIDRLDHEGRREESLIIGRQAVELYRQLAQHHSEKQGSNLARSLGCLSLSFSQLGRNDEALAAIQEAVDIRRYRAEETSATRLSELAESLSSLSYRLSSVGRHGEALLVIEEALALYKQLVVDDPVTYTRDLSSCLESFSDHLSYAGQHKEALLATEKAVDIRRRLAVEKSARYTPDLARSLNTLSLRLSDMGQHYEAVTKIEEAVKLHRQLNGEQPDVYTHSLAESLRKLSGCLSDIGRHEEALVAIEETVEIRRQLAAGRPDS